MNARFRLLLAPFGICALLVAAQACSNADPNDGAVPPFLGNPIGGSGGVAAPAEPGASSGGQSGMSPGSDDGRGTMVEYGAGGAPSAVAPPAGGASGAGGSIDGGVVSAPDGAALHAGFYVDGRTLRDRCGDEVVLRGVNEMVIYTASQDGLPAFSEMAKTGANSVRITWNTTGSAAKLDAAMSNAIANQMIPMVVLNDATGDLTKLALEVDYWVRSDVLAAIGKYEDKLLINVGNEVGNGTVTQAAFSSAYQSAITRMRGAGIHTPLVIDGSSWGQDVDMLQAVGPALIDFDPDHNLVFSVHMYWNDPNGTRLTRELSESVAMNLPLIVGEFAQHAVSGCGSAPFAYEVLMSVAKASAIGFLPWSWGAVKNGDCQDDQPFDMTTNGTYDALQGWGAEVAVSDANSIQNTSVRSRYVATGSCD